MSCQTCQKQASVHKDTFSTWYQALWSWFKIKFFSRKVSKSVQDIRYAMCQSCTQLERDGQGYDTDVKLSRKIDGKLYCGEPRISQLGRFESRTGCGCRLEDKVKYEASACPRALWGPGDYFPSRFVIQTKQAPKLLKDVYDVYPSPRDQERIAGGLGDALMATMIANSLAKKYPSKLIRLRLSPRSIEWARLCWDNFAPTDQNDIVGVGEESFYLTEKTFFEDDLICIARGISRAEFWGSRAGVAPSLTTVKIPKESHLWAKEEISKLPSGARIAILVPYSYSLQRTWPINYWVKLQQILAEEKVYCFVMDSPGNEKRTAAFPTRRFGGLDPQRTAALISASDILVGNDSGMAHLSGLIGTPTLALCSVSRGEIVFSNYPSVVTMQAPAPCTGCYFKNYHGFNPASCSVGCEAMMNLKPMDVAEKVLSMLAQRKEVLV